MRNIMYTILFLLTISPALAGNGRPIAYTVNGQAYEGYYISPAETAPLVFIIHDWDGLTGYEIERAGMLAELGYAVFALDLFGAGVRPTELEDKRRLTGELYKNRQKMRSLMKGAMAAAGKQGADLNNAVAVGYCFGGAAVLEWARSGENLKAFITFHGGLKTPEEQGYADTKGTLLVFHGTADTSVPMSDFADLAQTLEAAGIDHEMTAYSGAPHAFTVFGSKRYHEAADKKSWARFTRFLSDLLIR